MIVVMSIHWFCCSWGILALVQQTQRTEQLVASLSDECLRSSATQAATSDCLTECEREALADIEGHPPLYIFNREPWMCRRIAEGLIGGGNHTPRLDGDSTNHGPENGSPTEAYLSLLQKFGLMEPTRPEEMILKFCFAFLYLTLDTLFKGGISGARASANPLRKAWQARMDHLNLFLKEMNAPHDLKDRTRQFLRNTRDLELKRSFNNLYGCFGKQLSNEMRAHMSISIVRGVYYFEGCGEGFLRDLASKLFYEAFERGETIQHSAPTLSIVVQGTAVRGGKPFGIGECFGEDAIIESNALRDRRIVSALTYCETCCVTKVDIHATSQSHPSARKRLRIEALKIVLYRAPQLIAQYVAVKGGGGHGGSTLDGSQHGGSQHGSSQHGSSDDSQTGKHDREEKNAAQWKLIGDALSNLGTVNVPLEHREVHSYMHAINGGARLRGLASEQLYSSDPDVAGAAETATALASTPRGITEPTDALVDEDGKVVEVENADAVLAAGADADAKALATSTAHEQLAAEVADVKEGLDEMRDEVMTSLKALQSQMSALMAAQQQQQQPPQPRQQQPRQEEARQKPASDERGSGGPSNGAGRAQHPPLKRKSHARRRAGAPQATQAPSPQSSASTPEVTTPPAAAPSALRAAAPRPSAGAAEDEREADAARHRRLQQDAARRRSAPETELSA